MEYNRFPSEFSGLWAPCFRLFSNCYINFFDESYKNWKLYFTALFAVIHNITMWVFMSKIFTEKINIFEVAYMTPICTVALQGTIKAIIVLYRKSDIKSLTTDLASIWRTTNLTRKQIRIKKHLIKQQNLRCSIYYWSNICGAWLHLIAPLIVVLFRRLFLSEDCKLSLAFGSVFPFDPSDNWIIYLGTYSFQLFVMLNIVYALVGSEMLMITFCGNLAIEFALLREDLVNVKPFIKPDDVRHSSHGQRRSTENHRKVSIEKFTRRHQHLIRLSMLVDDVFNGMVLMNLLFTSFIVCFFGFASTVARGFVETANNFVGVFTMSLHGYMLCYFGELMKNESLAIADSAYDNLWYKSDAEFQKTIVLIIARSQRACCLTAWRQVPVTLNMFAKLLSTAWSYFSIVTTIYSRHQESI